MTARAGQTLEESLVEFLRTKQLLLVVDNCEHLLEAVAELVEEIVGYVSAGGGVGHEPRGAGARRRADLAVPSLGVPAGTTPTWTAVARVRRGAAVRGAGPHADADFALDAANTAAVVQVCRRLDGVPLAIELAAARVTTMSPAEWPRRSTERFEVLAGGRRRAVQRHQTLRAAIDWSYDLLASRSSGCWPGCRCSPGAAPAGRRSVCAGEPIDGRDVFELLGRARGPVAGGGRHARPETRYRLLETIREYGEERLADTARPTRCGPRTPSHYADFALRCSERDCGVRNRSSAGARMSCRRREHPRRVRPRGRHPRSRPRGQAARSDQPDPDTETGYGLTASRRAGPGAMPGVEQHPGYPVVLMAAAFAADARRGGAASPSSTATPRSTPSRP